MTKILVMLADDHPIVMTGFAMSLEGQGLEVVAQARTPEEALTQYQQLQPDVIVLDIRFGEQLIVNTAVGVADVPDIGAGGQGVDGFKWRHGQAPKTLEEFLHSVWGISYL